MNRSLLRIGGRCAAASILLAAAACAPDGSTEEEGQVETGGDGTSAAQLADPEVFQSVDISLDKSLPKFQGEGFTLVEELNLPGRRVEFYQAADGALFHAEIARVDSMIKSPEEEVLGGSALYEFLSGKPAPQRLIDAELSAGVTRQKAPPRVRQPEAGYDKASCQAQGGCEWTGGRALFLRSYCTPTDRYWEAVWWTGYSWIKTTGTNYMRAGVLVNQGQIRYEARYGSFYLWMLVGAGYVVSWSDTSSLNRDAKSSVSEADGDIYDHCVNYHY